MVDSTEVGTMPFWRCWPHHTLWK